MNYQSAREDGCCPNRRVRQFSQSLGQLTKLAPRWKAGFPAEDGAPLSPLTERGGASTANHPNQPDHGNRSAQRRPCRQEKRGYKDSLLSRLSVVAVILGILAPPLILAQDQSRPEPEEPDFAFLAGGPYTQMKNSIQVIHQTSFGTRDFTVPGGRRNEDEYLFFFRTEWGFTDRWELDVITPSSGNRERLNGRTMTSDYGFSDSILGLRYRLLKEDRFPFTLTMGPQLVLPTGSVRKGTGFGSAGFAWDVAAAKDWGGPAFLYTSFNTSVLPSVDDPTPGSARKFALHGAEWATALGLRALERTTSRGKHDIHIFLEGMGSWQQEIVPGITAGSREGKLSWVAAPGVRYGFMTLKKTLVEIGVSVPFGLGPNGPNHGVVMQFQFENVFGQKTM